MKSIFTRLRTGATAATVSVAVLVSGAAAIALAAVPDVPAATSSVAPTETTESVMLEVGAQMAIPVADAGVATVSRDGSSLTVVNATAEPGWQALVEVAQGREVEVSFRSDGVRHDLNVELEDGVVRIRIRTRDGNIEDNVDSTSTTVPGSSSSSTSTSTTVPGSSSSSTSTSTTVPGSSTSTSTTIPSAPSTAGPRRTVDVLDAGTATFVVDGIQIVIAGVEANDGWTVNVERAVGREVEATWRGPGRVDLNLELEDGQIRVRIRDRRTDTRTEVQIPATGGSTTVPSTTSTSTTVPSTTPTIPSSTSQPTTSFTETVASAGGTVTIRVEGNDMFLVNADPASGYVADIRKAGPDEVEVRFEAGDVESRIKLRVDDGRLRKEIEDR